MMKILNLVSKKYDTMGVLSFIWVFFFSTILGLSLINGYGRQILPDMMPVFWRRAILFLVFSIWWFGSLSRQWKKDSVFATNLIFISFGIDGLGNLFGFYHNNRFDDFVHLVNPVLYTILFALYFKNRYQSIAISLIAMLGILMSVFVGVVFEVVEYFIDLWFSTQMVGGLSDTIWDLVWDLSGAAMGGWIVRFLDITNKLKK